MVSDVPGRMPSSVSPLVYTEGVCWTQWGKGQKVGKYGRLHKVWEKFCTRLRPLCPRAPDTDGEAM
jgi:hypothetical protein